MLCVERRIVVNRIDQTWQHLLARRWLVVAIPLVVVLGSLGVAYWNQSQNPPAPRAANSARAPIPNREATGSPARRAFPKVRLSLLGTTSKDNRAVALISVEDRPAGTYAVGQELLGGIIIRSILADRVILGYGDLSRTLYLKTAAGRTPNKVAAQPSDPLEAEGYQQKNPDIDPESLTLNRIVSAQEFLRDVKVARHPRGGYVIEEVEPDSVYQKLGLRAGDVIHNVDTADNKNIDETPMEAAMNRRELQLEVYRNGSLELLRVRLDE
jgi:general secretion pathway protein C